MTIEITNVHKIHEANLASIGKRPRAGWQPTAEWCIDQLHAEDSTLEWADIFIRAEVSGTVASHVVRATKGHPRFVVESHRPDWTGKPRPGPDTTRVLMIKCTPYSFIQMCRQRMCKLASDETRRFFYQAAAHMGIHGDIMLRELAEICGPDCVYRGGVCHKPAKKCCGMCPHHAST